MKGKSSLVGEMSIGEFSIGYILGQCLMPSVFSSSMYRFEATRRIRDMEHNINNRIHHGELSVEAYNNVSNWHVSILAMTADVIQATREECLWCGMDGYVSKPFEAEQLYLEVSRFFQ